MTFMVGKASGAYRKIAFFARRAKKLTYQRFNPSPTEPIPLFLVVVVTHIHLDYLQRPPQRICEIMGDAGKVRYDYYENQVEVQDLETGIPQILRFERFDRNEMFMNEMRHFLDCLMGKACPVTDLREAKKSLLIGLLSAKSLETGLPVPVSL